jgi:uncharacterized SAM-dependent methyltransferase
MHTPQYSQPFHQPLLNLLTEQASGILADWPGTVSVVDLGPGHPDKSFPLLDFLRRQQQLASYIAVDLNSYFLSVATEAARPLCNSVAGIQTDFRTLPDVLDLYSPRQKARRRLFILGLTFLNFRPRIIMAILSRLVDAEDALLIATPIVDDRPSAQLLDPYYGSAVQEFARSSLTELGIADSSLDYDVRLNRIRIEVGFILRKHITFENSQSVPAGTRIVTAVSYRYPRGALQRLVRKYFSVVTLYT